MVSFRKNYRTSHLCAEELIKVAADMQVRPRSVLRNVTKMPLHAAV